MAKRPPKPPAPVPAKKKRKPPRNAYKPTEEVRQMVAALISIGTPVETIARVIGKTKTTTFRVFAHEINHGHAMVRAKVGSSIATMALNGDKTMMIFYAKAQMGWRERHALGFEDDQGKPTNPPGAVYTVRIE